MSFRAVGSSDDEGKRLLRNIVDRLDRLEKGGAIAGQVSFGDTIQIGDVLITVSPGVGTHRNLTFKNVLSGTSFTLPL